MCDACGCPRDPLMSLEATIECGTSFLHTFSHWYLYHGVLYHHQICPSSKWINIFPWWRHQMETFSALLAIRAGNSPAPGDFPTQRPVTPSFDVFFDLHLNKRLSKQSWGWWFETLSHPLWRHRNVPISQFVILHTLCVFVCICVCVCWCALYYGCTSIEVNVTIVLVEP